MMFSASFATAYYNARRRTRWYISRTRPVYAAAGVVVMFLVSKINYQTFRLLSVPGIVAAILLLVLALSPLGVELNEAKRWVRIGPIQFQPSEVAKVAVILFFATRLSKRDTEKKKKWSRRTLTGRTLERLDRIGFLELVPYGAILMVIALLMLMEPHMSGTILVLAGASLGPLRRRDQPGLVRRRRDPGGGSHVVHHHPDPLYDGPHQSVAGPMGPAAGGRLSDGAVPAGHRLRRPAGPGAGQEPTEIPLCPRAGKRLCIPHRGGRAGIHRGGGGAAPVLPC